VLEVLSLCFCVRTVAHAAGFHVCFAVVCGFTLYSISSVKASWYSGKCEVGICAVLEAERQNHYNDKTASRYIVQISNLWKSHHQELCCKKGVCQDLKPLSVMHLLQ
jgi:hypothetical protein